MCNGHRLANLPADQLAAVGEEAEVDITAGDERLNQLPPLGPCRQQGNEIGGSIAASLAGTGGLAIRLHENRVVEGMRCGVAGRADNVSWYDRQTKRCRQCRKLCLAVESQDVGRGDARKRDSW